MYKEACLEICTAIERVKTFAIYITNPLETGDCNDSVHTVIVVHDPSGTSSNADRSSTIDSATNASYPLESLEDIIVLPSRKKVIANCSTSIEIVNAFST